MKTSKNQQNINHLSAIALLLGCAVSASVHAQSGGYDSPAAGSYDPTLYVAPSANVMDPDRRFGVDHRGEGAGIRFGKAISPAWDIQFGPTYSRSRSGGATYRQNTLGVDGLYLFSRERFRPFLLLGAGAEYDKTSTSTFHADRTSPYVNAGVGFQYSFDNRWGMQADVRRAHSYLRGNDFRFDRANTNILTVGLTYAFDKRAAPMPVAMTPTPAPVAPPTAVAIAPAAPVVAPTPPPRVERYTLSSTELFAFDSSVLRMPQPKLDETADLMSRNPQITNVTITGYTDRLGSDKYNQKLSERRANAVKAYLTDKGVAANRLNAVGMGERNPVVTCTDKKRSALITCLEPNRRVEVEQIIVERRVQ